MLLAMLSKQGTGSSQGGGCHETVPGGCGEPE